MLENVHVDALGNLGTTVHPPDDVLALVEKFIGELYQPRIGHFNGAMVCVLAHLLCNRNNHRRAEKLL